MGELIICALAGVIPSCVFGVLLWTFARGERAAVAHLLEEAFCHLAARDAKDAAEAKATLLYQQEAMREQRVDFDRQQQEMEKTTNPKPTTIVLRDELGEQWEVVAGMD